MDALRYGGLAFRLVPETRGGRQCVELLTPVEYQGIKVPRGFITDFASVPGELDGVVSPFGPYAFAPVIHDWLYATCGLFGFFTRKECDDLFLEILKGLGVPWWKRSLMWAAVRVGGRSGFGS